MNKVKQFVSWAIENNDDCWFGSMMIVLGYPLVLLVFNADSRGISSVPTLAVSSLFIGVNLIECVILLTTKRDHVQDLHGLLGLILLLPFLVELTILCTNEYLVLYRYGGLDHHFGTPALIAMGLAVIMYKLMIAIEKIKQRNAPRPTDNKKNKGKRKSAKTN